MYKTYACTGVFCFLAFFNYIFFLLGDELEDEKGENQDDSVEDGLLNSGVRKIYFKYRYMRFFQCTTPIHIT